MGCEANVASRPATSPSPPRTHGRHVISPLLLPYYLFLVLIFVPISSANFIAVRTVPVCVRQRVEGKGPPLQQPPLFLVCS